MTKEDFKMLCVVLAVIIFIIGVFIAGNLSLTDDQRKGRRIDREAGVVCYEIKTFGSRVSISCVPLKDTKLTNKGGGK